MARIENIKENGYLYSLWGRELKVYAGSVWKTDSLDPNIGSFLTKSKRFSCSVAPGCMYNSIVWLEERDDERAKSILIDYEELQIMRLQERIDNHLVKIQVLKGELL